jgi:methyl-accepting chemotaxis protein
MNMVILLSILIISVFATINRVNVQKRDALVLVKNEINQVEDLLDLLDNRPVNELGDALRSRVFYNTGYFSIVSGTGDVLIAPFREGINISDREFFPKKSSRLEDPLVYTDEVTGNVNYQYHRWYEPLDVFIMVTLEKKEFIDKPVYNTLKILLFALIFTWIAFTIANYFIMKTITTPINGLVKVVSELGEGSLTDTFDYPYQDEVGKMAGSVNKLVEGLKSTALFANEIGKNNFDYPYKPLSDRDLLGNALLDMKDSLKTATEEERLRKIEDEKRNWTTQGLAKFADILRQNNDDMEELSFQIIRNLVSYLNINQGGIFVLNEDVEKNEKWLELTACYAFDRRKYLEKKVLPGEGLVGTCFLEQQTVYITKVPQDYIRITSGLGDENPRSLLLIPLKLNDQVFGVIELASFQPFEKYRLEFVEKIGESIASTISGVKINMQTAMLLEKSQQQAEEMKAQEEEMRQNMEELAATQEAMAEKERENFQTIEELKSKNLELTEKMEMLNNELAKLNSKQDIFKEPVAKTELVSDTSDDEKVDSRDSDQTTLDTSYDEKSGKSIGDNEPIDKKDGDESAKNSEDPSGKDNLHTGDPTDNQKAWSEHITQKGKTFRKNKKK